MEKDERTRLQKELERRIFDERAQKPTNFGLRLYWARQQRLGITQDELARRAGISANYYARIEREEKPPSTKIITRIREILGVSAEWLGFPPEIDETEEEPADPYPARTPLLRDPEFIAAPEPVRSYILNLSPASGKTATTREWYEYFSRALRLHAEEKLHPSLDATAKKPQPRRRK